MNHNAAKVAARLPAPVLARPVKRVDVLGAGWPLARCLVSANGLTPTGRNNPA